MKSSQHEQGSTAIIALEEKVLLDTVFGKRDSMWPMKINSNHMKKTLTILSISAALFLGNVGGAEAQKTKVRYA
ncbi:hypothetical protein, partial [Algoriphagus zhangzhouensis]